MPDVNDYFDASTLVGVLNEITPSESYTWYGKLPTRPVQNAVTAEWEVEYGAAQELAEFNTPGSEANLVGYDGRSFLSGALMGYREKILIDGFVERWTRATATANELQNAQQAVARSLKKLHDRGSNLYEWACWKAISGSIPVSGARVSATVDMGFKASHKATAATKWADASLAQIREDVESLKELIENEGNVEATTVYAPKDILSMLVTKFADTPAMLTDEMKRAYYTGDKLEGFMGLNWNVVRKTYDVRSPIDYSKSKAYFAPRDTLFIGNYTENTPFEILEGTTDDLNFDPNVTGWHARSWLENDPGQRVLLGESRFLPVITRPDQMATLKIA